MADVLTVSWIVLWILLRLILVALEKISSKFPRVQSLYYFCYPYEGPLRFILWGVMILFLYPLIAKIFDPKKVTLDDSLNFSWVLLEIGAMNTFKVIILNMSESHAFKDLQEAIGYTANRERWLLSMEQGTPFTRESALLLSNFSNKKISEFLSASFQKMEKLVKKQFLIKSFQFALINLNLFQFIIINLYSVSIYYQYK